jgi:hypothetical protein
MNQLGGALVAIATLLGLAGLGGATWAVIKASVQDATIKRLRGENDDYLKRLNYIEPKVEALERENKTLHVLHNPADAIDRLNRKVDTLTVQEQDNHTETVGVLRDIGDTLRGQR